jgi:NAD(P)-dependent dehydrogenase (short-subunit alcohol dehydrogenase family)
MHLTGKTAIVTGGSRGIGFGIAAALLDHGASVMISGLDRGRLDAAWARLSEAGRAPRVAAAVADVRDPAAVERLVDEAVRAFGGLDVLVNNAGVGAFSRIADLALDDWRRVIDTNVTGVFYCCRAAIPRMRERGGGYIINISSLAGRNAFPGGGAYCASKAALNAFSEVLMQEVRYDDIRVSYIMPGSVATDFDGPHGSGGADWKLTADDIGRVVVDLLGHDPRSLPSRVEIRPSKPARSG